MQLSDYDIDDFIALTKQEFGITLDRAEAHRQAMALVSLIERIYRPMTKAEMENVIAKMKEND